jgi:predicted nuclease of predicted toxin-antitoxin system
VVNGSDRRHRTWAAPVGVGPAVIDEARAQGRVLISADTDFGTLLARTHATTPSFLLIRRASGRRASEQAAIILSNLNVVQADLDAGAIVVLGEATLRIRRLPIGAPRQSG